MKNHASTPMHARARTSHATAACGASEKNHVRTRSPAVRAHAPQALKRPLAAIEVLVGIEENFGVEIAPTAVERKEMNTVNKIIDQIAARL